MNTIRIVLMSLIVSLSITNAKEPTNIMIGIGGGIGQTQIDISHSHVIRNPIYNYSATKTGTGVMPSFYYHNQRWLAQQNMSLSSWSGAWEFLFGYKHFVNDWIGFRAYANVGVQHYKPSMYESEIDPIGIIDYTLNADLLVDFYETEKWAIGMIAGLGFGGTSFDKKAVEKYMAVYDRNTGVPIGKANIKSHFLNINASIGLRGVYFQKVRKVSERVCDENYVNGKRLCRVPVHYIGHNFEVNAKFPFMSYQATDNPDIIPMGGAYVSAPSYKVTNPYRITFRYIIDF